MYSIADYGAMIADAVRMGAFARALRQTITPGAVVVDIGTGTGIFALLACRFGARRVYAIEPGDAIQVAREIAAANGYADRIEFIQSLSTEVTLPERAAIVISDIGGVLPWFQRHIPAIADARRRFLAPGGVLIPQCDAAWAAVVDAPELYARQTDPWGNDPFGLDMDAARRLVINTWSKGRVTRDHLLTGLERWATTDYRVVEDADVRTRITWTVTRHGTGHGFAAGFDRTVSDGVSLSNAPDAPDDIRPQRIYGTVFFPWPTPVPLVEGDHVTIDLEARLVGEDYVWNWKTQVADQGRAGASKAAFAQSTFLGVPLSPATVQKTAASYRPTLSADGRIARSILESMNGGLSVGEIAERIATDFSGRFPRPQDALSHVADLSRQYG
ncbi:MAG TPA: class I SAM-dependent methyltransferase [Vicinamibacterales bacterium]|nr:class I SAM-dependent methyltransferase [Vicinamibacterales bacterium]